MKEKYERNSIAIAGLSSEICLARAGSHQPSILGYLLAITHNNLVY